MLTWLPFWKRKKENTLKLIHVWMMKNMVRQSVASVLYAGGYSNHDAGACVFCGALLQSILYQVILFNTVKSTTQTWAGPAMRCRCCWWNQDCDLWHFAPIGFVSSSTELRINGTNVIFILTLQWCMQLILFNLRRLLFTNSFYILWGNSIALCMFRVEYFRCIIWKNILL